MKLLLCRLGLHWPLSILGALFIDIVSGKTVYLTQCPCGRKWIVDNKHSFSLFKVERNDKRS